MRDDDLDELAFILGAPSETEMLKQHNRLIESELEIVQADLSKARRNVTQLVDMHQMKTSELEALRRHYALLLGERNLLYFELCNCLGGPEVDERMQKASRGISVPSPVSIRGLSTNH